MSLISLTRSMHVLNGSEDVLNGSPHVLNGSDKVCACLKWVRRGLKLPANVSIGSAYVLVWVCNGLRMSLVGPFVF